MVSYCEGDGKPLDLGAGSDVIRFVFLQEHSDCYFENCLLRCKNSGSGVSGAVYYSDPVKGLVPGASAGAMEVISSGEILERV